MSNHSQPSDYFFERLSEKNIHHLIVLFRSVFKKRVSTQFFLTKYDTKSFGPQYIGYIAFTRDNTPAAFYGVIPCIIKLDSQTILAAQSADTMTHPDHRRKNLFITLAVQTYQLARNENIRIVFGFPNENSLSGLKKLKWQFANDNMQLFSLNSGSFSWSKVFFKSSLFSSAYLKYLDLLIPACKIPPLKFLNDTGNGVLRNYLFLKYKKYNRTFFTTIQDVDLWIKLNGNLQVGFADIKEGKNLDLFLKKLRKLASAIGCKQIIFITHKYSSVYNQLVKTILPHDSYPVGYLNLSDERIDWEKITFEYCDIDIF